MRHYPRFARNPRPECPTHGRTMELVLMPAPNWMQSTSRDLERKVWRCSQPQCPRVAAATTAHDVRRVFSRQSLALDSI